MIEEVRVGTLHVENNESVLDIRAGTVSCWQIFVIDWFIHASCHRKVLRFLISEPPSLKRCRSMR